MKLLWCWFLVAQVSLASKKKVQEYDVIADLDNHSILRYAKLCRAVYKLPNNASNSELADHLLQQELIDNKDKVVIQGTRHGEQLSSIMIKKNAHNHFTAAFIGTKSAQDVLSDINALPDYDNIGELVEEALLTSLPTSTKTWIKKRFRIDEHELKQEAEHVVAFHSGFVNAGQDFMEKLFNSIQHHYKPGKPVFFELTGHSMGGAMAAQAAYYIKDRLHKILDIPADQVVTKVILFAAAGGFKKDYLHVADKVIEAERSMVSFYRPHDFARELARIAGYANPGHEIELKDFVKTKRSLLDYAQDIIQLDETPEEIQGKVQRVGQNHAIKNYIATIEAGINHIIERTKEEDAIYDKMREESQKRKALKKKKHAKKHEESLSESDSSSDEKFRAVYVHDGKLLKDDNATSHESKKSKKKKNETVL